MGKRRLLDLRPRDLERLYADMEAGTAEAAYQKRSDVTPFALHDFRRPTARLLVAGGVDIVTAAAILGHKRASVLLDVYAKALRAPKRAAADKLQAVLYPAATAPLLTQPE